MKTNAFANLFDLQQGNQNRKDPPVAFHFPKVWIPVQSSLRHINCTRPPSCWVHPHLRATVQQPPVGLFWLLLLFEALASIAQVSRRRRASTPAEPRKREKKKKKCDGDMPCDQNVVNIRVQDDHLTRSLFFFSPVVAIAPIL